MDFNMELIANGIWKLVLGEPEDLTPVHYNNFSMVSDALEELPVRKNCPKALEGLKWKKTARGITVTLPMNTNEDIYGFGLQLKSLNQSGRKRRIRVNSDPPADTGESHAPAPFYVSSAGYGLFADTFRYADFYMGTNAEKGASAEKTEVNQKHEEFSESALYALKKAKEERKIIIEIPHVKGVTLYFFAGELKEAVQRYNLFSGGGCLPPMWGLGVWYRTYGGSDQNKVLELAGQMREDGIPVDVLGLEPGWHSHSYSCTFQWSSMFPEPKSMLDQLKEMDYNVNLWEHAFVYPASPVYQDLIPYSGDYEVWNGLIPDFGSSEGCKIFADYHEKYLVDQGVSGFKLDECDNSDYNPSNWSFPDSTEFPSGLDGEQMHNGIGMLYQNTLHGIYKKKNRRTLSQVRASGALAAPLPFVLYSDLYNHKDFIRGMSTAGFSGMLWSPEVRSCENGQDLLRRVESVVFSPQALLNCWRIPNPPWYQVDVEKNLQGERMEDWEDYFNTCKKYLELRMSLMPYLYSSFMDYHRKGIPPVRAVVMDYPEDEQAAYLDTQYMFGESMMVCPLSVEDGKKRVVWLPKGKWHDFFTGQVLEGGKSIEVNADYDEIPVYVKDGALIPLAKPVMAVKEDTVFQISVKSFGEGVSSFTLYEDDFVSYDGTEGNRVVISRDADGEIMVVRSGDGEVRYVIEL